MTLSVVAGSWHVGALTSLFSCSLRYSLHTQRTGLRGPDRIGTYKLEMPQRSHSGGPPRARLATRAPSIGAHQSVGWIPPLQKRPVGMAYDRSQIGTKTARTSLEKMDTRTPRAYIEVEATGARAAHTDHRDSARITSAICASMATFHSKRTKGQRPRVARDEKPLSILCNHFPPLHTHLASLAAHTHTRAVRS